MAEAEKLYPPKEHIAKKAHVSTMEEFQRLYRLSLDDPETFWSKQAERLTWFHPWDTVFDSDYTNVDFAWFLGGRLNAAANCLESWSIVTIVPGVWENPATVACNCASNTRRSVITITFEKIG